MRRKKQVLVALLAATVIVGGWFVMRGRSSKPKESEQRTEVVRRGPFLVKIRETGVLEPLVLVNVKSNVEGEIQKIDVDEGDIVEPGDVLIELDDRRIREEKNQAEANLSSAKAQLDQANRNVELTRIRQDALLAEAQDRVNIARSALESARQSSVQQLTAAELEITNTKTAIEQEQIALNRDQIALRQSELNLARAKSRLEAAQVTLRNADAELKRNEKLYEQKYVSKSALENAQAAYANAKTQAEQADQDVSTQEEAVKSARQAIASRKKTLENRKRVLELQQQNLETLKRSRAAAERQAELQLKTAETNLKQVMDSIEAEKQNSQSAQTVAYAAYLRAASALKNAEERLGWTRITAPIHGTVIQVVVEEGEIVQSGRSAFAQGPGIMVVADLSQMIIKTYINEVDIPKIAVGQPVEISADAYPDRTFEGRVKEISPQAVPRDNVTKFEVVVEVLGSPPELRPGMNVDVDIVVADRQDVVQLPIETLIEKTKLTASVAVPESELSSFSPSQKVAIETRSGKRFPGRVSAIKSGDPYPVVILITEDAPKGLRVGSHTVGLVVNPSDKADEERIIRDLQARVDSDRKQLVLVPSTEEEEKAQGGFLSRVILSRIPFVGKNREEAKGPREVEMPVKVGLRNDTAFELLGGLNPGDTVIVPELSQLVARPSRTSEK